MSDVSATLVARTTRRPAWEAKIRCCSADESRAYSGRTSTPGDSVREGVGGVADLPLAAQEHEHVAGRLAAQLDHRVADGLDLVLVLVALTDRAVSQLDGVAAA